MTACQKMTYAGSTELLSDSHVPAMQRDWHPAAALSAGLTVKELDTSNSPRAAAAGEAQELCTDGTRSTAQPPSLPLPLPQVCRPVTALLWLSPEDQMLAGAEEAYDSDEDDVSDSGSLAGSGGAAVRPVSCGGGFATHDGGAAPAPIGAAGDSGSGADKGRGLLSEAPPSRGPSWEAVAPRPIEPTAAAAVLCAGVSSAFSICGDLGRDLGHGGGSVGTIRCCAAPIGEVAQAGGDNGCAGTGSGAVGGGGGGSSSACGSGGRRGGVGNGSGGGDGRFGAENLSGVEAVRESCGGASLCCNSPHPHAGCSSGGGGGSDAAADGRGEGVLQPWSCDYCVAMGERPSKRRCCLGPDSSPSPCAAAAAPEDSSSANAWCCGDGCGVRCKALPAGAPPAGPAHTLADVPLRPKPPKPLTPSILAWQQQQAFPRSGDCVVGRARGAADASFFASCREAVDAPALAATDHTHDGYGIRHTAAMQYGGGSGGCSYLRQRSYGSGAYGGGAAAASRTVPPPPSTQQTGPAAACLCPACSSGGAAGGSRTGPDGSAAARDGRDGKAAESASASLVDVAAMASFPTSPPGSVQVAVMRRAASAGSGAAVAAGPAPPPPRVAPSFVAPANTAAARPPLWPQTPPAQPCQCQLCVAAAAAASSLAGEQRLQAGQRLPYLPYLSQVPRDAPSREAAGIADTLDTLAASPPPGLANAVPPPCPPAPQHTLPSQQQQPSPPQRGHQPLRLPPTQIGNASPRPQAIALQPQNGQAWFGPGRESPPRQLLAFRPPPPVADSPNTPAAGASAAVTRLQPNNARRCAQPPGPDAPHPASHLSPLQAPLTLYQQLQQRPRQLLAGMKRAVPLPDTAAHPTIGGGGDGAVLRTWKLSPSHWPHCGTDCSSDAADASGRTAPSRGAPAAATLGGSGGSSNGGSDAGACRSSSSLPEAVLSSGSTGTVSQDTGQLGQAQMGQHAECQKPQPAVWPPPSRQPPPSQKQQVRESSQGSSCSHSVPKAGKNTAERAGAAVAASASGAPAREPMAAAAAAEASLRYPSPSIISSRRDVVAEVEVASCGAKDITTVAMAPAPVPLPIHSRGSSVGRPDALLLAYQQQRTWVLQQPQQRQEQQQQRQRTDDVRRAQQPPLLLQSQPQPSGGPGPVQAAGGGVGARPLGPMCAGSPGRPGGPALPQPQPALLQLLRAHRGAPPHRRTAASLPLPAPPPQPAPPHKLPSQRYSIAGTAQPPQQQQPHGSAMSHSPLQSQPHARAASRPPPGCNCPQCCLPPSGSGGLGAPAAPGSSAGAAAWCHGDRSKLP